MEHFEHCIDDRSRRGCGVRYREGPICVASLENILNSADEVFDESIDHRPAIARGDLAYREHLEVVDHHRHGVSHDRQIEFPKKPLGRIAGAFPPGDCPGRIAHACKMARDHGFVELTPVFERPVDIWLRHAELLGDVSDRGLFKANRPEQFLRRVKDFASSVDLGTPSGAIRFFDIGCFHED